MIRAILLAALALFAVPSSAMAAPDPEASTLAPDFEGKVAYFGNYTGISSVLATQPAGARDIPCPYRDNRCRKATVGGGVKVVLEFHGERVIGFFYAVDGFRGPEGLKIGSLTGRRKGDGNCELFQADGSRWTGICGAKEFVGDISTDAGIPNSFDVHFNTLAMHVRDLGWIRQQRWEASRRDQRLRTLDSRLRTGTPEEKFFAAAELESFSWTPAGIPGDRFTPPQWPGKFKKNRPYDLRSEYPLAGGGTGWVMVRFRGREVECVATPRRGCGPIREPLPFEIESEDDPEGWFTADGRVITDLRAAEPAKAP